MACESKKKKKKPHQNPPKNPPKPTKEPPSTQFSPSIEVCRTGNFSFPQIQMQTEVGLLGTWESSQGAVNSTNNYDNNK